MTEGEEEEENKGKELGRGWAVKPNRAAEGGGGVVVIDWLCLGVRERGSGVGASWHGFRGLGEETPVISLSR